MFLKNIKIEKTREASLASGGSAAGPAQLGLVVPPNEEPSCEQAK